MKNFFTTGILLLTFSFTKSQDLIIKKNGDEIKSKVLEVNLSIIKYKKYDNLNGPTFEIKKADVFIIKYENGTKDIINSIKSSTVSIKDQSDEQVDEDLCFTENHKSTSIIYGVSSLFGGIASFDVGNDNFFIGPIVFSFDKGLSKNISLAIRPAIMYYQYNYDYQYYSGGYTRTSYNESDLFFGAAQVRLDYHFATTSKIDPYFGIGGGLGYFFGSNGVFSSIDQFQPLYGGGFGIKAYGKKKNALLIELGYDSYSYLKLGYTFKNRN